MPSSLLLATFTSQNQRSADPGITKTHVKSARDAETGSVCNYATETVRKGPLSLLLQRKQQKEQVVAELVSMLQGATSLYLLDYSTMTVAESNALRSELRKKDLTFKVAKNRLIQRALAEVGGFEIPEDKFFGQTGIICGYSDAIAPAKIIKEVEAAALASLPTHQVPVFGSKAD